MTMGARREECDSPVVISAVSYGTCLEAHIPNKCYGNIENGLIKIVIYPYKTKYLVKKIKMKLNE